MPVCTSPGSGGGVAKGAPVIPRAAGSPPQAERNSSTRNNIKRIDAMMARAVHSVHARSCRGALAGARWRQLLGLAMDRNPDTNLGPFADPADTWALEMAAGPGFHPGRLPGSAPGIIIAAMPTVFSRK